MTTELAVLNTKFEKSGSLKTNVDFSAEAINGAVVHQVVKATLLAAVKVLLLRRLKLLFQVAVKNLSSKKELVTLVRVLHVLL